MFKLFILFNMNISMTFNIWYLRHWYLSPDPTMFLTFMDISGSGSWSMKEVIVILLWYYIGSSLRYSPSPGSISDISDHIYICSGSKYLPSQRQPQSDSLINFNMIVRTLSLKNQSGALSLVEIVEILCSDWWKLNMLAPRSISSQSLNRWLA